MNKKKLNISIVGASGMVGGELLYLLEKRKFPINEIRLFSSGKHKQIINFKNKKYKVIAPNFEELKKSDIVFFVSNEEVSSKFALKLAESGIWCIDDSSYFRMDKKVPLIIPEVNENLINKKNKLIAGPNCTLTPLAVSCYKIHKKYEIEEIRISSYQAVSGAGKKAIIQLYDEIKNFSNNKKNKINKVFPHNIFLNVFPQVGSFDKEGNSSEENKVVAEIKKIWNSPNIKISVNTVRVPTIRTHCLSVWIKTKKNWKLSSLEKDFSSLENVIYNNDPYKYSTPLNTEKKIEVTVSRLRKTPIKNEFQVWLCGDNLYKGASLNSVQIAEKIYKKFY